MSVRCCFEEEGGTFGENGVPCGRRSGDLLNYLWQQIELLIESVAFFYIPDLLREPAMSGKKSQLAMKDYDYLTTLWLGGCRSFAATSVADLP